MYKCNAGSLEDKNDLAFNKRQNNLKVKSFAIPHCTYTNPLELKNNNNKAKCIKNQHPITSIQIDQIPEK